MIDRIKFYGMATIGTKGQIVIPTEARKDLDLKEGDKIIVVRAPHMSGLDLIKADALEEMIKQLQSHQSKILDAAKGIKDMAEKDDGDDK